MGEKVILKAIAVAGTLDIIAAICLTLLAGRSVSAMLAGIAAGPFGEGMRSAGQFGSFAGVATHYLLMAIMVMAFALLATKIPVVARWPIAAGIAYGLVLYVIMYWLVIPTRWPGAGRELTIEGFVVPVLVHITLVGLPISMLLSNPGDRDTGPVEAPSPAANLE